MERDLSFRTFVPICLENSDKSDDSPKWNMLCKPVVSRSHADGDFKLTTEMFHDAVRNFNLRSTKKLPINFDHFSEDAPNYNPNIGAPKQGSVIDMQVRADGCLWGLCDFKEPAKTYVKEGKYEHFSPEILLDSLDRESGKRVGMRLKGVALVGDPHLYDMPPVKAADNQKDATNDTENPLTQTAKLDRNEEDKMSKELEQRIAELEVQLKAKDVRISELTLELKANKSDFEVKLAAKTKEYDELVKEAVDGEVEAVFNTYKDSRKLEDADKEHLRNLRLANATSFRKMFPVKAAQPASAKTADPVRPAYLSTNLTDSPRPANPENTVKLSQADLHAKYLKEGMDNLAATIRAAKEAGK